MTQSISQKLAGTAKILAPNHGIKIGRYYYSADLLIRQIGEYRNVQNLEQLYVMLLRYSSLVVETLPHHREFVPSDRKYLELKKVLLDRLLPEAEEVKKKLDANEKRQIQASRPQGTLIARGQEPPNFFDFKDTRAAHPSARTNDLGPIIEITNVPLKLSTTNNNKQEQLQEPAYVSKYQARGSTSLSRHAFTVAEEELQSSNKSQQEAQQSLYPVFGVEESEMPSAPTFDMISRDKKSVVE
eukprot:TRINITY_DN6524_c0_g1_i1.p1 TRINITY_DN6524_c0_g1~~TRINITY_DN6524_c0_g1_i1.p1  ORF type:complete len:242 (-),score=24.49 TRINITY_DN6524_c0_g1_i1:59-784(-)